jgi:hypothetical protein
MNLSTENDSTKHFLDTTVFNTFASKFLEVGDVCSQTFIWTFMTMIA